MHKKTDTEPFLQALHERMEDAIREALEECGVTKADEVVKREARAAVLDIQTAWRGIQVYIPLKSDLLGEALYEEMENGARVPELAHKYGIAFNTVYKAYNAERARREGAGV